MTDWSPIMKRFQAKNPSLPHFTLHDLRRTMRTGLGALGVEQHVAELALNHPLSEELKRTYDKGSYWPERVEAAEKWAAYVAKAAA